MPILMNIYAKIAFAVMVAAMVLSYIYTKKRQRDIRLACNKFAFAFMKISNFVSPREMTCKLRYKHGADDSIAVRPVTQQCEKLKGVLEQVKMPQIDEWYDEAQQALLALTRLCGKNHTLCRHYRDPIQRLFDILRTFLVGCEDFANIVTQQNVEDFESFLNDQPSHRETLFKRISWDGSEMFAKLNAVNNPQDVDISLPEGKDCADTTAQDTVPIAAEPVTVPVAQGDDVIVLEDEDEEDKLPPESPLREKWRGWGCS